MQRVKPEVLEGLKEFDSPTVFNAMVKKLGLPNEDYTSHEIRYLLPEFGPVVGYAVTTEVTTNDPDSPALPWDDYYDYLDESSAPLVAVMKDADSRPGRGASFGDGMATMHKRLGVVGAVVDGTIRDLEGIRKVGLPMFAWGTVPGHGVFNLTRLNVPVTVGQVRIQPGDLIFADLDGCVRIPPEHAEDVLRMSGEIRARESRIFAFFNSPDFSMATWKEWRKQLDKGPSS